MRAGATCARRELFKLVTLDRMFAIHCPSNPQRSSFAPLLVPASRSEQHLKSLLRIIYLLDEREAVVVDGTVCSHVRQQRLRLQFNVIFSETRSDAAEIRVRCSAYSERRPIIARVVGELAGASHNHIVRYQIVAPGDISAGPISVDFSCFATRTNQRSCT